MNAIKAMTLLTAVTVGLSVQALTLAVKDVKIAQRYPWNGLVDIDYTVECDDPDADVYVYPVGYDVDMNLSVPPRTLTGDGANGKAVKAGTHRMTWDMAKDMGENYNRAKFSMKVHAYAGAAPYMVIDLSAGSNAEKYEVSYLNEVPEGGWSQEYKSTKLVLRMIPPGEFMMGAREDELGRNLRGNYEARHKVKLTQPFYMGVFELTQQQYVLVMGTNPSYHKGDFRPVGSVSYNMLRGDILGAKWPEHQQVDATSFFGTIRSRTGVTFDLPTEAQWEYACRAGTDTSLNSGKDISSLESCAELDEVARYLHNCNDGKGGYSSRFTEVGLYLPNAWGLYDMHGNVSEWCLDWWQADLTTELVADPVGPSSGSYRVMRGGNCVTYNQYSAATYRSAYRSYLQSDSDRWGDGGKTTTPDCISSVWGFRVVALPAAK